ncbi:hypothetical protein H1S01_02815 [Heliobacterium chlorum]|uniref:YceG-like family protein n=1 Tax=Heliobacterium chlorum TaxID=2698 RepID=A0ABR7T0S4_HELCL|nr:hypothetical protein [Heliobacterium chlorum]MBC9783444.1 hypothetical protein [Heliobacterium chlorum]
MNNKRSPEAKGAFSKAIRWVSDGKVLFTLGMIFFGAGLLLQGISLKSPPAPIGQETAETAKPDEPINPGTPSNPPAPATPIPTENRPIDTAESGQSGVNNTPAAPTDPTVNRTIVWVNGGDTSETVAEKLQQAGLIENTRQFNDFLINRGYARRLQNGEKILSKGMDEEAIAKILVTAP